ncbi:MAG: hypothetical protein WCI91_02345 [Candidatus Nomurabacteria bacterium]
MKKTIMIVQGGPYWLPIFKSIITQELPHLTIAHDVIYTDSFDEAVDLIPQSCDLCIISSEVFHDEDSKYRDIHGEIIPDNEKSGAKLAEMAKELNPRCKFYVFSEYEPEESIYIDGFIQKQKHGNIYSSDVVKVLKFLN